MGFEVSIFRNFRLRGWKRQTRATAPQTFRGRKPMEEENAGFWKPPHFFNMFYIVFEVLWLRTFRECTFVMFVDVFLIHQDGSWRNKLFKARFSRRGTCFRFRFVSCKHHRFCFFSGLLGDILGGITTATSLVRCFSALVLVFENQ